MELKYNNNEMGAGTYKLTNITNGRIYVGSTNHFKVRWLNHKSSLMRGVHDNTFLQRDYNKCGTKAFIFEILELIDNKEDRLEAEKKLVENYFDKCKNCYNMTTQVSVAEGYYPKDVKAARKNRSVAALTMWKSRTAEERKVILDRTLHKNNKGRIMSDEQKEKLRLANLGKKQSQETIDKRSKSLMGHNVSAKTIEALRLKNSRYYNNVKLVNKEGVLFVLSGTLKEIAFICHLDPDCLRRILNKTRSKHKGWKLEKESDI